MLAALKKTTARLIPVRWPTTVNLGYGRVSADDQSGALQVGDLKNPGGRQVAKAHHDLLPGRWSS